MTLGPKSVEWGHALFRDTRCRVSAIAGAGPRRRGRELDHERPLGRTRDGDDDVAGLLVEVPGCTGASRLAGVGARDLLVVDQNVSDGTMDAVEAQRVAARRH